LWELGQIEIGVGTLVAMNKRIDGAVGQSIDSLKEWIKQTQPNIHSDKTPNRCQRVKRMVMDFCQL
jgi:transposase